MRTNREREKKQLKHAITFNSQKVIFLLIAALDEIRQNLHKVKRATIFLVFFPRKGRENLQGSFKIVIKNSFTLLRSPQSEALKRIKQILIIEKGIMQILRGWQGKYLLKKYQSRQISKIFSTWRGSGCRSPKNTITYYLDDPKVKK